jgi:uncharacterized protein with PIN domain
MNATKLKGQITADRRLIVERLTRELSPSTVEVIVLQAPAAKIAERRPRRTSDHPAFCIWAKCLDIGDSAAYAALLRRRLESRTNGGDYFRVATGYLDPC